MLLRSLTGRRPDVSEHAAVAPSNPQRCVPLPCMQAVLRPASTAAAVVEQLGPPNSSSCARLVLRFRVAPRLAAGTRSGGRHSAPLPRPSPDSVSCVHHSELCARCEGLSGCLVHACVPLKGSHSTPTPPSLPCSVVAAVPGWLALGTSPSVLHCCWMVNTWAVVTATVLLPWLRVWQRERHARRRFAWQQLLEAAGESGAAAQAAGAAHEARTSIPHSALGLAMARDALEAWGLADDCRPTWAWILDAYLLSCAAWAVLLLCATARGI